MGYDLCLQAQAKRPYFIENIRTEIYSLEELCFYLYHNVCLIDETIMNEKLCDWIRDELGLPVAIYSGRNAYEWELAKKSLGWEDFPDDRIIHYDHGIEKPSPKGLEILCERIGASSPVFFGDTASDMKAQAAFGRGRFAAIGRLLPEAEFRFETTEEAVDAFAPKRA